MIRSALLDLLRIFAIALVFIAHFGQLLDWPVGDFFGIKNFYYVSLGGVGVSIFLVLSGILVGFSIGKSPSEGYWGYQLKKILRIYPLYWMSIPLAVGGYLLGEWWLEGELPELFPNGMLTDLWGSVTGFYSWAGLWGGPYNPPSWFISLIISMYVLAPLLLFVIKRQPHLSLFALCGISLACRWYVGQEGAPLYEESLYNDVKGWAYRQFGFMPGRPTDWFPLCRVFEFGLGIYLAKVVPRELWFKLKLPLNQPITLLSDIAFPLFLIHSPFLFLVPLMHELSVPTAGAIPLFLLLMAILSYLLYRLDGKVPRKQIEQKLIGSGSL